jgi:hypothetical protein
VCVCVCVCMYVYVCMYICTVLDKKTGRPHRFFAIFILKKNSYEVNNISVDSIFQ